LPEISKTLQKQETMIRKTKEKGTSKNSKT